MAKDRLAAMDPEDAKRCDAFRHFRFSCHMTQKEWAGAIGISQALVKKIETHSMKCSEKSWARAREFMEGRSRIPAPAGWEMPAGLDMRIFYDIAMSRISPALGENASTYAAWYTGSFHKLLEAASDLPPDGQATYFRLLGQLLGALSVAAAGSAAKIKDGEDVLNVNEGLKDIFNKKTIEGFRKSGSVLVGKDGSVNIQQCLFDLE